MIRNDLKEKLKGKDVNEFFLEHRPGIDQPGYKVGKIGEEIVVLNESSGEIMDYFYDDMPDKEWFSLSTINTNLGHYEISRNTFKVRNTKKSNKELTTQINMSGYLEITLRIDRNRKKHCLIHRALCLLFVPNPEAKKIVDHIDRDRKNNKISNLRWFSTEENNRNFKKPAVEKRAVFYEYSDEGKTKLIGTYTGDEIRERFKEKYLHFRKNMYRNKNNKYGDTYWKVEMGDLIDYLKMIGKTIDEIKDDEFVLNKAYDILVHPLGLVKFVTKQHVHITPGSIHNGYKRVRSNTTIHTLVASTFLNNGNLIPEGMQVDHINGNSLDNRVENLRIVTPSENMSNPVTIDKIKKAKKTQKN